MSVELYTNVGVLYLNMMSLYSQWPMGYCIVSGFVSIDVDAPLALVVSSLSTGISLYWGIY